MEYAGRAMSLGAAGLFILGIVLDARAAARWRVRSPVLFRHATIGIGAWLFMLAIALYAAFGPVGHA